MERRSEVRRLARLSGLIPIPADHPSAPTVIVLAGLDPAIRAPSPVGGWPGQTATMAIGRDRRGLLSAANDHRAALSLGCGGRDFLLANIGGLAAAVAGQSCSDPGSGLCRQAVIVGTPGAACFPAFSPVRRRQEHPVAKSSVPSDAVAPRAVVRIWTMLRPADPSWFKMRCASVRDRTSLW